MYSSMLQEMENLRDGVGVGNLKVVKIVFVWVLPSFYSACSLFRQSCCRPIGWVV